MKIPQNFFSIFLCFCLLANVVNSQLCPSQKGQPEKDLLQTGIYTIVNENYQKSTQSSLSSYQIPLTYTPTSLNSYSIAISTLQISSQQTLFVDFSLRTYKKLNSFSLVLVSSLNEWKSYTVSYLVSSREEINIGSIFFDAFAQNGDNSKYSLQGNFEIQGWNDKKFPEGDNDFIVKVFISGVRTIPNKNLIQYLQLFITQNSINTTTGQIYFRVQNPSLVTVITIEFNYILFSKSKFRYDFEQITVKGSGVSITKQNFQNLIVFIFGGLTGLSSQKAINNNFTLLGFYQTSVTCKGSKCKTSCISKKQCTINKGRIINQSKPNEHCLIECNENQTFNSLNQCVCSYGFEKRNGKCQQIVINLNCNPITQMINYTTRKCQCKEDHVLVGFNCEKKCNVNGFINGTKCQCLQGYKETNGFCHNCQQHVDAVNKKCYCAEPQFYQASNGSCIRSPCKSNLRYFVSENKCGCQGPKFVEVNGNCVESCGINQYKTAIGLCLCLPGFTQVKQKNGCFKKVNCTKANEVADKSGYECFCKEGFQKDPATQNCVIKCPANQTLTSNKSSCECIQGYKRDFQKKNCLQVLPNCGFNQIYDKNIFSCRCKDGFIKDQTMVCSYKNAIVCSQNQQFSSSTQSCTCLKGFQRNSQGFCQPFIDQIVCPSNMIAKNSSCACQMGLKWNAKTNNCELNCTQNSIQRIYTFAENQTVYICQCIQGYKQSQTGKCEKIPDPVCPTQPPQVLPISCPGSSIWDSVNYKCYCNSSSLFFINGTCKPCDQYQTWNGQSCVCQSGYNFINNKCLKCDENSVYRGGKCNCNYGFYDQNPNNIEKTLCKSCHVSCGTCFGPSDSQCLTCADPQASLANGKCSASLICPKGSFNSSNTCKKCSQYCSRCKNQNQCTQCTTGFQVEQINILNMMTSFCSEICGDGKRFEYECDDGNLIDGDGCDSGCFIEKGWVCNGGSPTKSSVCMKSSSIRSILTSTKPLRLFGQIAQGFTLSYIPDQLSENGCVNCNDILLVKLISYAILPSIETVYLPTTRFKFSVKFSFNGIFAIPDFVYSVQINPKYSKYFSVEDMSQKIVIPVIPADLAINNQQDTLSIDDMI